jgi:hypothetical protein
MQPNTATQSTVEEVAVVATLAMGRMGPMEATLAMYFSLLARMN